MLKKSGGLSVKLPAPESGALLILRVVVVVKCRRSPPTGSNGMMIMHDDDGCDTCLPLSSRSSLHAQQVTCIYSSLFVAYCSARPVLNNVNPNPIIRLSTTNNHLISFAGALAHSLAQPQAFPILHSANRTQLDLHPLGP